ncbi:hypothetical protein HMPREF1557_00966 [Streptococcus sobrinus W1703]|uniref:Uncharacterized protein n=1 Tax=Streptococcus sobrinus W1703 TaxID=1227275 RepID=U2KH48_9STRE|nr:hypothetical protein HMPREF1557_00966 [Streptococcus sobrinus W1703]
MICSFRKISKHFRLSSLTVAKKKNPLAFYLGEGLRGYAYSCLARPDLLSFIITKKPNRIGFGIE